MNSAPAFLGNTAKFVSAPHAKAPVVSPQERRARRYKLQDTAAKLLPKMRVQACMKRPTGNGVNVIHCAECGAHYSGLQTCGSIWVCPVCAAKISEKRRAEITQAVDLAHANGWYVVLVTLTLQHILGDLLRLLLGSIKDAWRKTKAGRRWLGLKKTYGLLAHVTAVEITHGASGWHPHMHILLFFDRPLNDLELKTDLYQRYGLELEKQGRYASFTHGVDVKIVNNENTKQELAKYLTKWGLGYEVAKGSVKTPRSEDGLHPYALLAKAEEGDKEAARLFVEYAEATRGLSCIRWSKGARELFQLGEEKTDEELAAEAEEGEAEIKKLITLEKHQWATVTLKRKRAALLDVADLGDPVSICIFLAGVVGVPLTLSQRGILEGQHGESGPPGQGSR